MIVRFQNNFHVPGFGRRRFQKGVVFDVPESLQDCLPATATVLPDDHREDTTSMTPEEELRVADTFRANAEAHEAHLLRQSGHSGFAEEEEVVVEVVEEPVPPVSRSRKKGKRT